MDEVKHFYGYINRETGKAWGEPVRMTEAEFDQYRKTCGRFMKIRGYKLARIPDKRIQNGLQFESLERQKRLEPEHDPNLKYKAEYNAHL